MSSFSCPKRFPTKAERLKQLEKNVRTAIIPPFLFFTVEEWGSYSIAILNRIESLFSGNERLAVRSSARSEDQSFSNAGKYRTCLNVPCESVAIRAAVQEVIDSLGSDGTNQVLVQQMVTDIKMSGVILTHDLETGSPYYRIDYDTCERTDGVTSGALTPETCLLHRNVFTRSLVQSGLRSLVTMVEELETLLPDQPLNLEFATDKNDQQYLLQVRSISCLPNDRKQKEANLNRQLNRIRRTIGKSFRPKPGLAGQSTILTQMSDWNPAELLGAEPRPLAASLFHHLIGKRVWQEARSAMGYRPVPGQSLVQFLAGRPYVDVRLSFNSFLPQCLPDHLQHCLVDAWLERLRGNPELHDQVEFEVAQTTRDLSFRDDFQRRYRNVLRADEFSIYEESIRWLTNQNMTLAPCASLQRALTRVRLLAQLQTSCGVGPRSETKREK